MYFDLGTCSSGVWTVAEDLDGRPEARLRSMMVSDRSVAPS
jgi:hypothetical protein